jgi:hypothetical protein
MKTYENYFGNINYSHRFNGGLNIKADALFEDRIPLNNTTNYTFYKSDSGNITPNYPYQVMNAQFPRYQATILSIELNYKPGTQYLEYPDAKVPVHSVSPTFTLDYSKAIRNLLGSDEDFDKWKFTINDDINLKLYGTFKYKFTLGGFLNSNKVYIQDYQHFNANRSLIEQTYVNSFQMAGYFTNSTTAKLFGLCHLEHHFNGFLSDKIPVINNWHWNLVAGTNSFYVGEKNNYADFFIGFENILKIFRVDFIVATQYGTSPITGIEIGTGGIIGNHIDLNNPSKINWFSF